MAGRKRKSKKEQFLDDYGGTVSHGTLRSQDLGPAFFDALDDMDPQSAKEWLTEWEDVDAADFEHDDAMDAIADLEDRLNELAPDGVYFGAHPGDGSDFGFWESEEDEEESE